MFGKNQREWNNKSSRFIWKDVTIYVLCCGDSDKMLDEDSHMPSRRMKRATPILYFDSEHMILHFEVAGNRICGETSAYDLYSSSSLFEHGAHTDCPSDEKDKIWLDPQYKELYSPHSSVTHENKLPWIPICHTLSSNNLSLKWTEQRFPSGQRPISQFAWWPFALWLLLNEVSKISIVLGRKHLKSLSKESLAPPHYYTIVQFKIHHLTYCFIYLICSPALSMEPLLWKQRDLPFLLRKRN